MRQSRQWIALALSAIVIFTAGAFWGKRRGNEKQSLNSVNSHDSANQSGSSSGVDRSNVERSKVFRSSAASSPESEEIMRNLRDAMLLPPESRTMPLLKALEETTKLPLSKDLLAELQKIVDEGEIESSHYVLSLMEQREEKASIELLLHAATHQSRDVADRALFALEAVAGNVFKSQQEAAAWATTWKPDPEREKLFAPVSEVSIDSPTDANPRIPGPRSLESKPHTIKRD